MTIEEKNVEIALMLEWERGMLGEFTRPNTLVKNSWIDIIPFFDLKFHLDANWQFEAIEWIEKQNYMVEITSQECSIFSSKISDSKEDIIWTEGLTKKEAIFEALYQFSQYIKEKT